MKLFSEFDNECFGGYDVILHASETDMREILAHFNQPDAVPDMIPAKWSKYKEDLYLFFINTLTNEITPMWSYNYAYGSLYNGYGPVGKDLPDFNLDLDSSTFRMFTPLEEMQIERNNTPRDQWPDKNPVFRGKTQI